MLEQQLARLARAELALGPAVIARGFFAGPAISREAGREAGLEAGREANRVDCGGPEAGERGEREKAEADFLR